ncbi:unnamed protein product [Mytilus edulis]|uniref:Uncharacterized protein n=1 Tax=Mytilus edulis TaxID=6550 RepID=A0A8S3QBM0_MYTED|nr:unnamed protein product [Mytilus edulis]
MIYPKYIYLIFLRSCSKNRKKKRRPYTTARNGSEVQDKALLVMLSSNNPSSPGYESSVKSYEFFEYAQAMVTAEQDLIDDEIINDHCSKQSANANNEVNHYESVEAAHYSQYNRGSHRNQKVFSLLIHLNQYFTKVDLIVAIKLKNYCLKLSHGGIKLKGGTDNAYAVLDPKETGFNSNSLDNALKKVIPGDDLYTGS